MIMSDEITIDGITYVSTGDASIHLGLSRDYIARLCREGRVRGRRIGKNWYVERNSFQMFIVEQEYHRKRRAELLAHDRVHEYKNYASKSKVVTPPDPIQGSSHEMLRSYEKISPSVSQGAFDVHEALARAIVRKLPASSGEVLRATAGLASQLSAHTSASLHTLSPLREIAHKLIALAFALMLMIGTYAFVAPEAMLRASNALQNAYVSLKDGNVYTFAAHTGTQLAIVVESPGTALASTVQFVEQCIRFLSKMVSSYIYTSSSPNTAENKGFFSDEARRSSVVIVITPQSVPSSTENWTL